MKMHLYNHQIDRTLAHITPCTKEAKYVVIKDNSVRRYLDVYDVQDKNRT